MFPKVRDCWSKRGGILEPSSLELNRSPIVNTSSFELKIIKIYYLILNDI